MRLWSLHPKYLDRQGLVAQWREGLLAKKVLEGKTKGYKNHPQLNRFKQQDDPLLMINVYLHAICDEADKREYSFDRAKLLKKSLAKQKIYVSTGQIEFEWKHLMRKLFKRSRKNYFKIKDEDKKVTHPLFKVRAGEIENWEILN